MYEKQVSVTLAKAAWQRIVNLLDQERNVVKAMTHDNGPLGAYIDYIQAGILAGMTNTIDSICQQAEVVAGQKVE